MQIEMVDDSWCTDAVTFQPKSKNADGQSMSIAGRIHEKVPGCAFSTSCPTPLHASFDQFDDALAKGSELVFVGDGDGAGMPLFADLVEQRGQNSEDDINGLEVSGDRFLNKLLSQTNIIPSPCLVERIVNTAEKLGVLDDIACEYIRVL